MNPKTLDFNRQNLIVSNEKWTIELCYESRFGKDKSLQLEACDKSLELNETDHLTGTLKIITQNTKSGRIQTCLIIGIDGGLFLHTANEKDNSCSIKLIDDFLICSLGFTFMSFDILAQEIKWDIRPDGMEIFEFYELADDFLLRGELEIHRIDREGNIKWSYRGRDIWVNIDGKDEIRIDGNRIILTDFESTEYVIDFDGRPIDPPIDQNSAQLRTWWKFW